MGRWEPDAVGRLRVAATELYVERGYEQTTVADIAERAGLTARTFFRYFGDKREVLFHGSDVLEQRMTEVVRAAPDGAAPIDAVAPALDAAAELLGGRRSYSCQRQEVIATTAELRERELIKLARLSDAIAGALRDRGTPEPGASLAAEAVVAAFKIGFGRWVAAGETRPLQVVLRDSFDQLRSVIAA